MPTRMTPRPRRCQHVAWLREYFRRRDIYNSTPFETEEEDDAFWKGLTRLYDKILATPPRTIAASAAQLLLLTDGSMTSELPVEQLRGPIVAALPMLRIGTWKEDW